jgi:hypothetical protein
MGWLMPTVVGLKLRKALVASVASGVTPDGSGPLTGSSSACTGTIVITMKAEIIKRTIAIAAVVFVFLFVVSDKHLHYYFLI